MTQDVIKGLKIKRGLPFHELSRKNVHNQINKNWHFWSIQNTVNASDYFHTDFQTIIDPQVHVAQIIANSIIFEKLR